MTTPPADLPTKATTRAVTRIVRAEQAMEGAGVSIRRVMPQRDFMDVDPFVLLDEFRSSEPNVPSPGFPPHPHRGIETVTYMLAGRTRHTDSNGDHGVIGPGSVQWMTAGRGIVHSEMPEQQDGEFRGFQLWINLPGAAKMTTPSSYRELPAQSIPTLHVDGVSIRIISGSFGGRSGPAPERTTEPLYVDVSLPAAHEIEIPITEGHAAFAYVYDGEVSFGSSEATTVHAGHAALLEGGDTVRLVSRASGRVLLFAGRPIREPIMRHGPFVMTTANELRQAVADIQAGTFLSKGGD